MSQNQIQLLLKYQEEDEKILRIENEVNNSEQRKNYMKARAFLKAAPEKLDAMDARALELAKLLEKLVAEQQDIAETLTDFENIDELVEDGGDISFYKKNLSQLTEKLKKIKSELNNLTKSAKEADEEFQAFKKKTISIQKQYEEYKNAYQEYRAKRQKEAEAVREELEKLSADISEKAMNGYQTKRSERIFPVICAALQDRCSKCGMSLSIAGKEALARGDIIECENCHRYLFKG